MKNRKILYLFEKNVKNYKKMKILPIKSYPIYPKIILNIVTIHILTQKQILSQLSNTKTIAKYDRLQVHLFLQQVQVVVGMHRFPESSSFQLYRSIAAVISDGPISDHFVRESRKYVMFTFLHEWKSQEFPHIHWMKHT